MRGARKYDPQTDSIVFATNHPFTMDNYVRAGLGNADLFRFCRRMTNMKVDNAEFALMTAIDIFSERYGLQVSSIMHLIQRWDLHLVVQIWGKINPTSNEGHFTLDYFS